MRRFASFCLAFAVAVTGCGGAPDSGHPGDAGAPRTGDAAAAKNARESSPGEKSAPTSLEIFDTATGHAVTRVLLGDPLDVVLSGVPAGATVTLRACLAETPAWESSAVFVASPQGTVDVATAPATSGSYSGADADGLLWSMTRGSSCGSAVAHHSVGFTASVGGKEIAHAEVALLLVADGVSCSSVTDQGLVGYYCARKGAPRAGGIVAFGGSEGGLGTGQALAEYYASLGYPTLGLAYFGAGSLPSSLSNVPLEYFEPAFAWLAARSEVLPGKLVVNGLSRGGELALLLGATFPEVTGVIAEVPSGVLWGSCCSSANSPAWTYMGAPLPYITAVGRGMAYPVSEPGGITAYADVPEFTSALAASTPEQITAATTQVQKTNGPILMIAGFDDQLWGACDLSQYSVDLLVSSGHAGKYPDSLLCYPAAGHNVTAFALDWPTTESMYFDESGQYVAAGGTPQGIAHAARDADTAKRAFFGANLR
jgi:dienelactone hydrolase